MVLCVVSLPISFPNRTIDERVVQSLIDEVKDTK